jgi:hypothetical protein
VKGTIYGFWVEGVEVADGAKITKMAKKAEMSKGVQEVWMTARHVMQGLDKVAV